MRLAVWSGPRNISTALMRSWENRPDTVVVDEPLYAHYLAVTGLDHPGRDEVIAAGETDWRAVVSELTGPLPDGVRVHYQKHMAHHLVDEIDDRSWILAPHQRAAGARPGRGGGVVHPVAGGGRARGHRPAAAGAAARGARRPPAQPPLVVDATDFLDDPEVFLRELCRRADVAFTDRMLRWPPGPRASDGVWAPHWYAAVERSTGFERRDRGPVELHGTAAEVARACRPAYEHLHALRWTPSRA